MYIKHFLHKYELDSPVFHLELIKNQLPQAQLHIT